MKKTAIVLTVLAVCLITGIFTVLARQEQPNPSVKLNLQEWQLVYDLIDNAAVPGEVRKPILKKIQDQITAQMTPPIAPKVKDTTTKKH